MSILRKFILEEIKRSFNLSANGSNSQIVPAFEDLDVWGYHGLVTQDIDDIHEFIYKLNLSIGVDVSLNYFSPQGKLAYFFLPKIKLHWKEKVQQVRVGTELYNIISDFKWDDKYQMFKIENLDVKMKMKCKESSQPKTINIKALLVPCKLYTRTIVDNDAPKVKILNKKMQYEYSYLHFEFIMNRQGIYVNRKYRDKYDIVDDFDTKDCMIVEPTQVIIEDKHKNTIEVKL